MTTTVDHERRTQPSTATERCDRCGACAQVRVVVASGELLFCRHHARAHHDRLIEIGASITS